MSILLSKIRFKIKNYTYLIFVKLGLYFNSAFLIALGLSLAIYRTRRLNNYKVLVLGRSIFLDDIKAMADLSGKIQYYILHKDCLNIIFNNFSTTEERLRLREQNYHTQNICDQGKKRYYELLVRVIPHLKKITGFQAVIAGNFGYVVQQEFARVCKEQKIPYLVLHKEGVGLAAGIERQIPFWGSYKFVGARALVYNEKMKKLLLRVGLKGLTEDNIEVVGVPRLDYYFKKSEVKQKRQITLFSFMGDKIFFLTSDKNIQKLGEQRIIDFHKIVINFAQKHPEIKVVIKTKMAKPFLDFVNKIIKENFPGEIKNLMVTNLGGSFELIQNSTAIVCLRSTTSLEAIIAGKTVISPYIDDLLEDKNWDFFKDHPKFINYVKTEAEFEKSVLQPEGSRAYTETEKNIFLEELIGPPDGKASYRTEAAIIKVIEQYNN
jgi:hypothetical protein